MKVEFLSRPEQQQKIPNQDYPARRDPEYVISEDGYTRHPQVREPVVKSEVVDREGLKGACENYDHNGLPFGADEGEGQREKSADIILHRLG